ncbi:MAG: hypothetical protein RBT16_13500, partial [Desulfococcus multivorans]|nr:hypothetical protein [Desulfococcus multivorans]
MRFHHRKAWMAGCLWVAAVFLGSVLPAPAETTDQLVIFVRPEASAVARAFHRDALPEIERLAKAM